MPKRATNILRPAVYPAFNFMTEEEKFRLIYQRLKVSGKIVEPRGLKIIEVENFDYELEPYQRWTNFESRKLNIDYTKREFRWYLKGDKFDLSIVDHAKLWKSLITTEGAINSNYGQYIFGEANQFDYVVNTLTQDKDSRRASIVILNRQHVLSGDSDLPCTYSLNFRIRRQKLNMSVRMRSQDAIYGMGNDAPAFSFIHEMLYNVLKEVYPNLEYGNYYHSVDSFHVYEKHWDMLDNIISTDKFIPVDCPKISGKSEVDFLRKLDFSNIPEDFQFTKWLTN